MNFETYMKVKDDLSKESFDYLHKKIKDSEYVSCSVIPNSNLKYYFRFNGDSPEECFSDDVPDNWLEYDQSENEELVIKLAEQIYYNSK